jgi:putative acetyltransferase
VAEMDGTVVGHVLGSRAHLEGLPSLGLAPLGVLPEYQGCGAGSALMHAVLGAADALDLPEPILLGDPPYYARFGFELAHLRGVHPPQPEWAEHFQIRTLSTWTDARRGSFRYAPAFDAVS